MREWARESTARAPAAAPHMNTSSRTAQTASRASQPWRRLVRSSSSVLIGSQRDQHIILRRARIESRRLLLGHHGLRGGGRLPGGLAVPQITAQNGQYCERGESHAASEGELPAKQTGESRPCRLAAYLLKNARVEAGGGVKRLFGPQRSEALRDLAHALHFLPAEVASVQVCLEFTGIGRVQRARQVLFEAVQDCRVHTILPVSIRP